MLYYPVVHRVYIAAKTLNDLYTPASPPTTPTLSDLYPPAPVAHPARPPALPVPSLPGRARHHGGCGLPSCWIAALHASRQQSS